jgi:N-methylhydantoinase A
MSALGCAMAEVRHDFVTTVNGTLADASILNVVRDVLDGHRQQAREFLENEGYGSAIVEFIDSADMSYVPQSRSITAVLPWARASIESLRDTFNNAYGRRYGRTVPGEEVRIITLRTSVSIQREVDFDRLPLSSSSVEMGKVTNRSIRFGGERWDAKIFDQRSTDLPDDTEIRGPAIVERTDGTIFIPPGWFLSSDSGSNFSLRAL